VRNSLIIINLENMNEIIKIENLELLLTREFLVDENNIKKVQIQIEELKKNVYDFSTIEGVKEAKELKAKANKFIKELKDFCEPLEADGKKIADARSAITTKLATGKNAVIEQILAPVYEREDKLKSIKAKLFIPSLNSGSNAERLAEIEALTSYDWLAFREEAEKTIEQHQGFLINEKIKFDEEVRLTKEAEEKAALEREDKIRIEGEARANAQAELKIKQETERLEKEKQDQIKAEQNKIEAEKRRVELEAQKAEALAKNRDHQAQIHNKILESLKGQAGISEELAKEIIKLIAKGQIDNLVIKY